MISTISARSLALLASSLFVVSVGCGAPAETSTPVAESTGYSGEALMKAVFFDIGPAAEKLVDPHTVHAPLSEAQLARADALVAEIASRDPDFFLRFAADLQSGDPLRVQPALSEGNELLLKSKFEVPQLPTPTPVTPGRPVAIGGSGIAIAIGSGTYDVVVQATDQADNQALAYILDQTKGGIIWPGGGGGGVFERERYSARVAAAFRR